MRKVYAFFLVLFLFSVQLHAQQSRVQKGAHLPGEPADACIGCARVMNGNDTLQESIRMDSCGLNYVTSSIKLGQRVPQPGPPQPVSIALAGIPCDFSIVKAYIWASSSGMGGPFNISITNPQGSTGSYPLSQIGSGPDKCWGFQGTYSYRGDVSAAITGNGTYSISGVPTSSSSGSDDIDGLTLMVIYKDMAATYEGHIVIADGAEVQLGFPTAQSIPNINACDTSITSRAFMAVGDMQNIGSAYSLGNNPPFTGPEDWWNFWDTIAPPVVPSVNTSAFTLVTNGDCYNMVMIGIYYQTNSCNICIPQTVQTFDVETNETQACPGGLASATATPNGGTAPYSYTWQPSAQTGQTANNLPPGTYVVFVTDSGGCASGTDSVSIVNSPAPNAQFILSPSPVANFPGQVCMTDVTSGAASWVWTVDNTTQFTSSSACYTLLDTGTICIELIVTDTNGCLDTAESCVTAISEGMITTPNVFTPNADGVNDVFAPTFTGMRSMSCVIYNRWGSEVYEWEGLNGSWNGKTGSGQDVADGVYYYVFTAIDLQDKKITQQGFVQLIREK